MKITLKSRRNRLNNSPQAMQIDKELLYSTSDQLLQPFAEQNRSMLFSPKKSVKTIDTYVSNSKRTIQPPTSITLPM